MSRPCALRALPSPNLSPLATRSLLTKNERPRTECHLDRRVGDLSNYSLKDTVMAAKFPNIVWLVQTDEGMSSSVWDFDKHSRGYTQLLTGFGGNADKMPKKRWWKLRAMHYPKTILYYHAGGEEEAKIDRVPRNLVSYIAGRRLILTKVREGHTLMKWKTESSAWSQL
jgi:hypothetical protein